MSWLFGVNKGAQNLADAPQVPVLGDDGGGDPNNRPQGGSGDLGSNSGGYRSEAYSFDSTALERAAKAAKVR